MSIKTLRIVLPFVGWAAAAVVGADPETKEEKPALFQDTAFRRGFLLNFPSSARGREVIDFLSINKKIPLLECLGKTKGGCPKHPLYLKKDLRPQEFAHD